MCLCGLYKLQHDVNSTFSQHMTINQFKNEVKTKNHYHHIIPFFRAIYSKSFTPYCTGSVMLLFTSIHSVFARAKASLDCSLTVHPVHNIFWAKIARNNKEKSQSFKYSITLLGSDQGTIGSYLIFQLRVLDAFSEKYKTLAVRFLCCLFHVLNTQLS